MPLWVGLATLGKWWHSSVLRGPLLVATSVLPQRAYHEPDGHHSTRHCRLHA